MSWDKRLAITRQPGNRPFDKRMKSVDCRVENAAFYESKMHRLFVAIRPPEPIRDRLIDAMDDSPDFRWQDDAQLHLTLRFIGEVERPLAEDLADALGRVRSPRFALRLKSVGRFDQRSSGALWAGVEPREPVAALAAKIERVCLSVGLEPERRVFHPHITLARWKGHRSGDAEAFVAHHRALASDPFEVDHFALFESRLSRHGAHYEEIASYPLR
jgi:2'-5' RNA ligase